MRPPVKNWKNDTFPCDYILICPKQHTSCSLPHQSNHTIIDFFNSTPQKHNVNNETWLHKILANPIANTQRTQHYQPPALPANQQCLFDRLPTELIDMIVKCLLQDKYKGHNSPFQFLSILALALVSPLQYTRFLERIHRDYALSPVPSWAGERIGFHAGRSAFTREQLERFGLQDWDETRKYERVGNVDWTPLVGMEEKWINAVRFVTEYKDSWGLSDGEWELIRKDLRQDWLFESDKPWVLRNLETREYVRGDQLDIQKLDAKRGKIGLSSKMRMKRTWRTLKKSIKKGESSFGTEQEGSLTLGQIFLVMTAYCNPQSLDEQELPLIFHDGPWHSHAFDLVPLGEHAIDRHEYTASEDATKPWMDVTQTVVSDVQILRHCVRQYMSVYGYLPGWATATKECPSLVMSRVKHRASHEKRGCKVSHGKVMSMARPSGPRLADEDVIWYPVSDPDD